MVQLKNEVYYLKRLNHRRTTLVENKELNA